MTKNTTVQTNNKSDTRFRKYDHLKLINPSNQTINVLSHTNHHATCGAVHAAAIPIFFGQIWPPSTANELAWKSRVKPIFFWQNQILVLNQTLGKYLGQHQILVLFVLALNQTAPKSNLHTHVAPLA